MKNIATTIFAALMLLASTSIVSQNSACESGYVAFKEGVSLELTHYDKKGKPSAITKQKVLGVEETVNGFKANIEMDNSDEKGKNGQQVNYDIECNGNSIFIDMRSMMNPASLAGMKDMEMEVSGDALEFPNDLSPGQTLPDGTMEMKAMMNGMALMNFKFFISNRKVEGTETVTTPAGTFDCIKMSQETEIKSIVKMKMNSTTWYAKGVGMVKTENYDKNGKSEGSTVLMKFEK